MDKRRLGRPVLTEAGVAARVTNAAEWEAPPGMEKRRCRRCLYWFAAPADSHPLRCPTCERGRRGAGR